MSERPPIVSAPVYLDGAPIPAAVRPFAGMFGGAVVGALVAYFLPRIIESVVPSLSPDHGREIELEIGDD